MPPSSFHQLRRAALQSRAHTSRVAPACAALSRQDFCFHHPDSAHNRIEGDVVLLRESKETQDGRLVKLQASKSTGTHRGVIKHQDVIGKEPRQMVNSHKGATFRVHEPTLAEYIYPSDTNLIVSLLDIHVDTPSTGLSNKTPFEILEAGGTGHGALTLHLAIHAANPPIPKTPSYVTSEEEPEDAVYLGESLSDLHESGLESWKQNRRAIIHTLDISDKHSKHAKKIVKAFAMASKQKAKRKTEEPFLSHVFLDLPNATSLANVAPALHVNGLLAVFNPSITQIAECVESIREQRLPYLLDQVIELGAGTIREWDVRAVKPSTQKGGSDKTTTRTFE
ncbi:unnamed protein product [Alternaria alternata]